MKLNPDSHLFEEQDFVLLRAFKEHAFTVDELRLVSEITEQMNGPTLPELLQRIRFLMKMDMIEIGGIDLLQHEYIYSITDVGKRFVAVLDRLRDKVERSLQTRIDQFNRAAEQRYKESPSFENFLTLPGAPGDRPGAQLDAVWLWELGIRADDDLLGVKPTRRVYKGED